MLICETPKHVTKRTQLITDFKQHFLNSSIHFNTFNTYGVKFVKGCIITLLGFNETMLFQYIWYLCQICEKKNFLSLKFFIIVIRAVKTGVYRLPLSLSDILSTINTFINAFMLINLLSVNCYLKGATSFWRYNDVIITACLRWG